jgi:predicted  nucleic acid-binding Zn-ribbon protein
MTALVSTKTTPEGTFCTFRFPPDYCIPRRLEVASQEDCIVAFDLVEKVLATQEKYCLDTFAASISKDLSKQHEEMVEALVKKQKQELLEQEKQFRKTLTQLEVSLDRATCSQDVLRTQYLEEAERRISQQKDSDLLLIQHLKEELEQYRQEKKELETKLQARTLVQQNASRRGRDGEERFEALAKERKGWTLVYSGDKGHSADYQCTLYNVQIRFEVKDYTHVVPAKEVEKLRRDLREHPETDVGVFLSLNTGISGVSSIQLEWTPTNQLILFLPFFLQQDIDMLFHFLDLMFQLVKPYRSILASTEANEDALLKERIDRTLVYAQNGLARITQTVSQFQIDVRSLQDRLDDMTSHLKTNMAAQKEELQSLIAILTGKDTAPELQTLPSDLPAVHEQKKKASRKKKDMEGKPEA